MNYTTEIYEKLRGSVLKGETYSVYGKSAFLTQGMLSWLKLVHFYDGEYQRSNNERAKTDVTTKSSTPPFLIELLANLLAGSTPLGIST